ncbi:MAG TPA: SDR family NAD(P)-dependent oxidoreductase, partial [Stellaceae bacterium]|nr:SDR family NAD(P)-dependent oxidoreductase [Stellaceae bacterium]
MLKGKTAIVTGSTSGIGLGIATALAAEGCDILLNGFGDRDAIAAIAKRLGDEHGVRVAYSPADMAKPADIRAMVQMAAERL